MWCRTTSRVEPSGRLKGTRGRGLGEKKGANKGKLANCTKMPVQPKSVMRGEGVMRADKAERAARRPERCGAKVLDKGGERQWLRDRELRPRESKCTRKAREGEAGALGSRCANGEESTTSDGESGSGSVEMEPETRVDEESSESEAEDGCVKTSKGIGIRKT
jgi:hypothetical protein